MDKKRVKKIKIKFCYKATLDLGLLIPEYSEGELEVRRDLWKDYVAKRYEFEVAENELLRNITKVNKRKLDKAFGKAYLKIGK